MGEKGLILGSSDMRPDASAPQDGTVGANGAALSAKSTSAKSTSASPTAASPSSSGTPGRASSRRGSDANVGNVLRSVYQSAVQEDIPAEMLDLLSKLD